MSKLKHKKFGRYEGWDDSDNEYFDYKKKKQDNKNRRKSRQMKNDLRSKNIDSLMRYDDDE